jgi:hypothetical protein
MPISSKSAKILWADAAGRCSFPECFLRLTADGNRASGGYTLGEMAHIKGERPGSNRYDPCQPEDDRNSDQNLILLCPTHHTLVDRPENEEEFPVERLQGFKASHEAEIESRLSDRRIATKFELARLMVPLLDDNLQAFTTYGPLSEIARRNPQSDAHATWLEERLTTIVPNNRTMTRLLEGHRGLFDEQESRLVSRFLQHARSYDRWVRDESSYEGVPRFPREFDDMIRALSNAGI